MVGLGVSSIISVRVLFRGLNRLENKDRFNAAVRSMKEDRVQNSKAGPYRSYQQQPAAGNDDATVEDSIGTSWAGAPDAAVQGSEFKGSKLAVPLSRTAQYLTSFQVLVLCLKRGHDGRTYERREALQETAHGMLFANGI